MGIWLHPFDKSTITSRFGDTAPPRTSAHRGTDYAPRPKALINAITNGKITDIYWSDCLGWVCEQESESGKYRVSYCHLSCHRHGINCQGPSQHKDKTNCMKNLKVGDEVIAGTTAVGRCGNTGSCSRGSHLHAVLGKSAKSAVSGKVYDIEKYIDKQIKKNKTLSSQQAPKPTVEAQKPAEVQTPTLTTPNVSVDDCEPTTTDSQGIPAKIMEAIRTILLWLKK